MFYPPKDGGGVILLKVDCRQGRGGGLHVVYRSRRKGSYCLAICYVPSIEEFFKEVRRKNIPVLFFNGPCELMVVRGFHG
jgi:hypothetical protein